MLSLARSAWCINADSTGTVDSENNHGGSSETYVLRRPGYSQENDQLLREGRKRPYPPGRKDRRNATGTGRLDEDAPTALDGCHGGDDLHRLDIRLRASHATEVKVAHPVMLRAIAA